MWSPTVGCVLLAAGTPHCGRECSCAAAAERVARRAGAFLKWLPSSFRPIDRRVVCTVDYLALDHNGPSATAGKNRFGSFTRKCPFLAAFTDVGHWLFGNMGSLTPNCPFSGRVPAMHTLLCAGNIARHRQIAAIPNWCTRARGWRWQAAGSAGRAGTPGAMPCAAVRGAEPPRLEQLPDSRPPESSRNSMQHGRPRRATAVCTETLSFPYASV
jgi:hypothetical protein